MLRTCRDKSPEVQNVSLSALQSESGIPGMLQYGRYRASVHILPSTPLPPPAPSSLDNYSGTWTMDRDGDVGGAGERDYGTRWPTVRYTARYGTHAHCTMDYGLWTTALRVMAWRACYAVFLCWGSVSLVHIYGAMIHLL